MVSPAERRPVDDTTRDSDVAQLSALSTTLDDLSTRISRIAGRYQGTSREDVSHGLYEVERSLLTASRRLTKAMRSMR